MPAFFLALLTAALASFGGRDQRLVSHLSGRLSAGRSLLTVAWLSAIVTGGLAAAAGAGVALILPPAAKHMLVAFALLLGGIELAWPWRLRKAEEPTRSAPAILIVLCSLQIGDGARLLILAIAVVTGDPIFAGVGGAIGSGAMLTMGWAMGPELDRALPLRPLRYAVAGLLLVAGVVIGLSARGIIG
ncbi:hypothetical protein MB02_11050 [Croceicoccus estronivorus]|uniref:hypothetical protein n=1 Tax=Croceicoccus estronivorus TaxID=1172626 RepID=UPI00082B01F9|nr:hypothetical protein [Croceicoccus estronivorus]OCC23691.1 hypothetical protein MB02_11050 [Croceicoccus estronivorus]